MERFCIFCGDPPENKDLEHPLPMWLLKMTGDPNRVVNHGFHWKTGKLFRFSFDSLKFPSCSSCNRRYSKFENDAKAIVEAICTYRPVRPEEYVHLLNWLDKVRVAIWLGNQYLQKRFLYRHFTIDSRIGTRDRLVAIYALNDKSRGLNIFGTETPLFLMQPSTFGIRINNMLLVNASTDWLCSTACGYPAPNECRSSLDHDGGLLYGDVVTSRGVRPPLVADLDPAAILMAQPVAQIIGANPAIGCTQSDEDYCVQNAWSEGSRLGPLFQQHGGAITRHARGGDSIKMIVRGQSAKRALELSAQVYEWQIRLAQSRPVVGADPELLRDAELLLKERIAFNVDAIRTCRMPQADYEQAWKAMNPAKS